jgi:outer membrane receptor for ferrienterochelin and colicin
VQRHLAILFGGLIIFAASPALLAEEKKKSEEKALEEELSELKDADYPDLVGADEEGEIIDEFTFLQEEDIIFSAAKHEQDIAESPSAITVITREQIENSPCVDLVCLLRGVPEVDVKRVLSSYAAVGARSLTGETGDKVLLLVDGMEVNEEVFGLPYWQGLSVHLEDVQRIEVIRGPGSALYGANAFSAIVSVTTRNPEKSGAGVFLGAGEHDCLSLHAHLDQRLSDNLRLHVSGGRQTDGHWTVRDQRDRGLDRVRLRLIHEGDWGTSVLQGSLVMPAVRIFTKLGMVDVHAGSVNTSALLAHRAEHWKARVYFRAFDAEFTFDVPLYFQGSRLGQLPDNIDVISSNLDAEFQLDWSPWEGNLLISGGNYRWNSYISSRNLPEETQQHRVGLFVQDEQRLFDSLILTGGVRFDWNNISPTAFSPRLAAVWRFAGGQHLRAAFGTAFRKPSFLNTSIHIRDVREEIAGISEFFERSIGNRDLKNERLIGFELGYIGRFLEKRLVAEADVFYTAYRDTIAFHTDIATGGLGMPDLTVSTLEYRNEGMEVDSAGGSVSLTYQIRENLRASINYTYRYSWYVSEPTEHSAGAGEKQGARVAWEPAHMFNASVYYLQKSGLRLGAAVHAVSPTETGWTEGGSPFGDAILLHNPASFFISTFAAWRQVLGERFWEAGIRAYNVFNDGFRDTPAVTLPDGGELGGQLMGRRIFLYLRAGI